MKKVVIIGCGAVAYRWYFDGILNSQECELAALVDNNKNALNKAGEYLQSKNLYNSVEEFFDSEIVADIALILTQHSMHFDLIETCLNHGLNVYSEKPFVDNVEDAEYLLNLAHKKNLLLASAPQVKLSSRNKTVKKIVESGVLGKIALVRASGSNLGPASREDTNYDPKWFYNDGGSLASLGIYTLSLVIYFFGTPSRISSYSGIAFPRRKVLFGPNKGEKFSVTAPDNQIAMLDYGDGMYVMFDGSYTIKHSMKYEFIIHGEYGTLYVSGFGGKQSIILETDDGKEEVGPDDNCHLDWNLFWGVDDLAKSIEKNITPVVSAEFSKEVIAVMETMRSSNDLNQIVSLKKESDDGSK